METGTRVTTPEDRTGRVTDTGCDGQVVWVTWDDDDTVSQFEQVEDGEWGSVDSSDVVTPR